MWCVAAAAARGYFKAVWREHFAGHPKMPRRPSIVSFSFALTASSRPAHLPEGVAGAADPPKCVPDDTLGAAAIKAFQPEVQHDTIPSS